MPKQSVPSALSLQWFCVSTISGLKSDPSNSAAFCVSQKSTLTPTLKFDAKTIGTECAVSSMVLRCDNLRIEIRPEQFGSFLRQPKEHVDSHTEIRCQNNRYRVRCLFNGFALRQSQD